MNGGVYSLYTRDRHGLLNAMMSALASDTTKISFEGTLSHTDLLRIAGVTHDESGVLRRATLAPQRDFIVLPLSEQTLPAIMAWIDEHIRGIHGHLLAPSRPISTATRPRANPKPVDRVHRDDC